MNKMLTFSLAVGLSLGLSGCLDSEVSCSGEIEKELVEEITIPYIKEQFIVETMNEITPFSGLMYQAMKNMSESAGLGSNKKPEAFKSYEEATVKAEKEFASYKFSLNDIRTTSKDKELNKVECSGAIHVSLPSYEMNFDIDYEAQLGDDKETVYVEVGSLE